jgi:enamine deaminase RidA (YjgF/YER057c/UK114 family)
LLAVAPGLASAVTMSLLRNPHQCEPFRYGSAFARGVVLRRPGGVLIEVSGTAAVDDAGNSLHPGDMAAQVRRTLRNVEALLAQESAGLQDISSATVFLKHAEHAGDVARVFAETGLTSLPMVCVVADICREELLFELDAEVGLLR